MLFLTNSLDAARFAADIALRLENVSPSITIIQLARSEDFFVYIVTDTSSEDIVGEMATNYFWQPIDISIAKRILAGLSQSK
jgi:hypothetical protein